MSATRPWSTGSKASRSRADADSACIWARLKSVLRRSYSSASRNTPRNRSATAAREPPAASFALSERSATTPTGDLTSICSIVAPSRSIRTAWPLTRLPVGTASAVVIPSIRDGDDRRGRVDPFRHVEGRGDGVALHARVARPRHRADLHQADLAGPVDEARGDPFPGGVDAGRIRRNRHVRSHGDDTAVADQYAGVGELRTGDGIDRSTRDGNSLGEQQRDHRSLPGAGISPSSKSVRGWCARSERSYVSQPSL